MAQTYQQKLHATKMKLPTAVSVYDKGNSAEKGG